MRNNETGEFELVVGNRQLLSGFFIVVLLFAVAFAMGYVVGENSRTAKAQADNGGGSSTMAATGDPRPQAASAAVPPSAPITNAAQPVDPSTPTSVGAPPQPTTQPSREVQEPVREPEKPKREAAREPAPEPKHAPPPTIVAEPKAGRYLQVLATANQKSAQDMVRSLQDKGMPATMSPGPNNWIRVLVGPYPDIASMGKAKSELEAAGLKVVKH
jgi:cell division septation protein DedD